MISSTDFAAAPAVDSGTFNRVPGMTIRKTDGTPDTDHWGPLAKTVDMLSITSSTKLQFHGIKLSLAPNMRDTWAEISDQMDSAIGKFMDGDLSGEELGAQFQQLSHELYEASVQAGYPDAVPRSDQEQGCTEAFYSEFRRKILSIALQRNNEQGRQYVTGEMNARRVYKYYNADYYYKSEDAIAAITKGMDELVQDRGWDYTMTDYMGKGLDLYANFNTVFSNRTEGERYCLDPETAPPRGFEWFYQTGSASQPAITARSIIEQYDDGSERIIYQKVRTKFDPADYLTANTWVAYTGKDSTRYTVNLDVIFQDEKSDLMNLGSLLSFDIGEESETLNTFLNNLQLYPKHYFNMHRRPASFDRCI